MKFKKNLLNILISSVVMLAITASITAIPAHALADGAYTVSYSASYVNPETGEPADGGTQIELGNSMVVSVVGDNPYALVEQTNGKTYVTVGLGLMDNVSEVSIKVQTSAGGGYKTVGITNTGNSGSDYQQYRFEVVSPDLYISPVLYVTPMGRNVQFFIKLNMSTAASGTGVFISSMIPDGTVQQADGTAPAAASEAGVSSEGSGESEVSEEPSAAGSYVDPLDGASGLSIHKVTSENVSTASTSAKGAVDTGTSSVPYVIGISSIVGLGGGGAGFLLWKRRDGWV